jgi:hypothetical protein
MPYTAADRARQQTPKAKAAALARRQTPEGAARRIAYRAKMPIEIPNRSVPDRCECCGDIPTRTLHFDHCHDTGRFRGWCCHRCNCGNGIMDSSRLLRLRALYLDRPFQSGQINWAYPNGVSIAA